MSSYVRLKEHSDWGTLYLALPGKGLSPSGTSSASRGLKFRDGQKVHVRWPDKSETLETIVLKTHREHISDMGHEYDVTCKRPGVETSLRGRKIWTPLAELDVLVSDLDK